MSTLLICWESILLSTERSKIAISPPPINDRVRILTSLARRIRVSECHLVQKMIKQDWTTTGETQLRKKERRYVANSNLRSHIPWIFRRLCRRSPRPLGFPRTDQSSPSTCLSESPKPAHPRKSWCRSCLPIARPLSRSPSPSAAAASETF